MKFKYRVGDKVRVIPKFDDLRPYVMEGCCNDGWVVVGSMHKHCGQVVTIKELDYDDYCYHIDDTGLRWTDGMFEGLAEDKKVFTKNDLRNGDVIVRENGSVEIVILDLGLLVTKYGWNDLKHVKEDLTDCDSDEFDSEYDIVKVYRPREKYHCQFDSNRYMEGELVYDRERDTKPLYNGKVVCIEKNGNSMYTVGKIYQFKDGQLTADHGKQYPKDNIDTAKKIAKIHNFDEWSNWSTAKWIEIKE